jgi:hypothetical protein
MAKAFTDERWRERDIQETLLRIVAAADPAYVSTVPLAQFAQCLIEEVRFLLPGDDDDLRHVEHYIRTHGEELYRTALTLMTQRRASLVL